MSTPPSALVSQNLPAEPPTPSGVPEGVTLTPLERPSPSLWQNIKTGVANWLDKQAETEKDAESYVQQLQAKNDAEAAAKNELYETNPQEFERQHPLEYLYRRGYNTVKSALTEPALEGASPALREYLRPKVENLVETGLGLYNIPKPGEPKPAISQGVILPDFPEGELPSDSGYYVHPNGEIDEVATHLSHALNHVGEYGPFTKAEDYEAQVNPERLYMKKSGAARVTYGGDWIGVEAKAPVTTEQAANIAAMMRKHGVSVSFDLPNGIEGEARTPNEFLNAVRQSKVSTEGGEPGEAIEGVPAGVRLQKITRPQTPQAGPRTLEYNDETGRWKNAKGDPVARMDVNSLGFMSPDGTVRVAPERTQGFEHSIYEHADMFPNKAAMQQELANGGVRFGRTPGTSRDAYVSIAKTDPETIQRAINVINRLPVDDFFLSVEKPDLSSSVAEFSGTGKQVIRKLNERFGEAQTPSENAPNAPAVQKAIQVFGTTSDPEEAGFILPDGRMLDFSGKNEGGQAGTRSYDHRDIWQAFEGLPSEDEQRGGNFLSKFERLGGLRLNVTDGDLNVTLNQDVPPTEAQMQRLRSIVGRNRKGLYVEVYNKDDRLIGNLEKDYARQEDVNSFVKKAMRMKP